MDYRKLKDLNKLEGNPRIIKDDDFQKLCTSIKANPDYFEARPLILSNRTGQMVIIAGNQRYEAAKHLGLKEVPTYLIEGLTEEREREIIIRDNVNNGQWDWDALANNWEAEELKDWGVDVPVFEEAVEAEEDDFDVPEGGIETDIVLGDLFEIGLHRLLCGDSTQTDTWGKVMNGCLADMVMTDPPYNVDYQGGTGMKIMNDKMDGDSFYQFLYDFYTALGAYTKAGGGWYVWHADSEGANFRLAMKNAGIMVKQCLIWVKNALVMGRQDYQWKHEPCLYGWKEGASHGWYSDRKQTTILEFDRPSRSAEHPTMKPIPLFAYQIGNSSKQGDIVADAFGGSGTTMVACHQMNRKAYLVELDPKYCQVIVDRMLKLDPSLDIKRNGEPYQIATN
jgi:DNA modification methylase